LQCRTFLHVPEISVAKAVTTRKDLLVSRVIRRTGHHITSRFRIIVAGISFQFLLATIHAFMNLAAGLHAFVVTSPAEPVMALLGEWLSIFGPYTEASQIILAINVCLFSSSFSSID